MCRPSWLSKDLFIICKLPQNYGYDNGIASYWFLCCLESRNIRLDWLVLKTREFGLLRPLRFSCLFKGHSCRVVTVNVTTNQ